MMNGKNWSEFKLLWFYIWSVLMLLVGFPALDIVLSCILTLEAPNGHGGNKVCWVCTRRAWPDCISWICMNIRMFSGVKTSCSSQIDNFVRVSLFQLIAKGMEQVDSFCSTTFIAPTEGNGFYCTIPCCDISSFFPEMINLSICMLQCTGSILHNTVALLKLLTHLWEFVLKVLNFSCQQ